MAYRPFRELGLKVLALGLAVLLWTTVSGQRVVERGLQIPLEFENVPTGLLITGELPAFVQVRVRGSAAIVNGLEPGEVVAHLNLSGEHPGRRLFDLFAGRVRVPAGVEVTSVIPSAVAVTLERAGEPRTIPIVPEIEGVPAKGFMVGQITTSPEMVEVIGPETRLAEVREALTEPVSVAGATRSVETTVAVGVADPTLRLAEPVVAHVMVEVTQAPVDLTLHDVPIRARPAEDAEGLRLDPAQVTVGVRGPKGVIDALDPTTVLALVDLAGLEPGQYNLPVTVESGADLSVAHIDPPSVSVTIR